MVIGSRGKKYFPLFIFLPAVLLLIRIVTDKCRLPFKEQVSSIVDGQQTHSGLSRRMSGAPSPVAAAAASAAAIVDKGKLRGLDAFASKAELQALGSGDGWVSNISSRG